ncbi:MAG: anhydro-N-acetylmuramic acid kinase, partial [Alphaproteobacteria bacterium]|nr:anhydro-N-acetylmuramic acid kinase [Alphaproteobacteria bacterium]
YDEDGKLARSGTPHQDMLNEWLSYPYFNKTPPKSLDRDAWDIQEVYNLPLEDAAATLSEFTVKSVSLSLQHLPDKPRALYVTGGGRHNGYIMKRLSEELELPVQPVEVLGWNGDALEAQGFAYLAVRSMLGLLLTLPATTGAPKPLTGGVLYTPST